MTIPTQLLVAATIAAALATAALLFVDQFPRAAMLLNGIAAITIAAVVWIAWP